MDERIRQQVEDEMAHVQEIAFVQAGDPQHWPQQQGIGFVFGGPDRTLHFTVHTTGEVHVVVVWQGATISYTLDRHQAQHLRRFLDMQLA